MIARRSLVVGLALAAVVAAPASAVTLDSGHVDALAPQLVGGQLQLKVKDDTVRPAVVRDVGDVLFVAKPEAQAPVPASPDFAFLGGNGARVSILPQTQDPRLVWPGWSTEHASLAGQFAGPLRFALEQFTGPGRFHLFASDPFGGIGQRFASSAPDGGFPTTNAWTVGLGAHVHANWAFSAPGEYALRFRVSGTLASGSEVSDVQTYRFRVDGTGGDSGGGSGGGSGSGGSGGGSGSGSGSDGGGGSSGSGSGSSGSGSGSGGGSGSGTSGSSSSSVSVINPRLNLRRGRVALRIRCRATTTCRGTARLRTVGRLRHDGKRRVTTLARGAYRVRAGRTATVRVRPSLAIRRTLRKRASRTIALRVAVAPRSNGERATTRRLTLRTR
ncbi:MAG: choice-of-anchor M domain-containing protein [Patulibacter sp.]|nr:choice-of-anchor M domain-containing protein [Patulibacter sp.]